MMPITNWLLPEPDSPTMARVSPAFRSRLTPLTASTMPSRVLNFTLMFLSERMLPSISAILWIKGITQAVADEIEGEQSRCQEEGGKDEQIGGTFHVART